MFPAHQRLSRSEFSTYFATGTRYHQLYCTMVYTKSTETKVAVVVGKKVSKKAVVRNRLRRRSYAAARRFVASQPATATSGVYIIILKPAAKTATRQQLAAAIAGMFAQISNSR